MKKQELTEASFPHRSWERELYTPLVGDSMLELGNKIKGAMVYKDVFEGLGFRHVSVDMNGRNGALKLDLREPLNLGTFDMVTNLGTSEHVSQNDYGGQTACWNNILDAMHVGSVLVSITPKPGAQKWARHGRWYPEPMFFDELARLNGLEVERSYEDSNLVYARLSRVELRPFEMPGVGMYKNPGALKSQDNI